MKRTNKSCNLSRLDSSSSELTSHKLRSSNRICIDRTSSVMVPCTAVNLCKTFIFIHSVNTACKWMWLFFPPEAFSSLNDMHHYQWHEWEDLQLSITFIDGYFYNLCIIASLSAKNYVKFMNFLHKWWKSV